MAQYQRTKTLFDEDQNASRRTLDSAQAQQRTDTAKLRNAQQRWALGTAIAIAAATALVAVAFVVYTTTGGAFSWRTPGALLLRVGFWAAIAWGLWPRRTTPEGRHA